MRLRNRLRNWIRDCALLLEFYRDRESPRLHNSRFTDHERWAWEERQRIARTASFRLARGTGYRRAYKKAAKTLKRINAQMSRDVLDGIK
jgi:phage terminase Nu1 subunit (DNA packaging protein)